MKSSGEETDAHQLASYFHSLYRKYYLRKSEKKQVQRRDKLHRTKSKHHRSNKTLLLYSSSTGVPLDPPRIEILGNCSPFSAFVHIRQLVLDSSFAEESKKWLVTGEERADNENDNATSERVPSPLSLPKVVSIGLETVFQLVKDSETKHPLLCVKALEALLHVLGGQYPQSLRKEPVPVIESLFSTLLTLSKNGGFKDSKEISTTSTSSASSSEQAHLTSLATACLISLAIAKGETRLLLEAISSLFICSGDWAEEKFESPDILKGLQRSVHAILVGRPSLPQWLSHGIPVNSNVDSFTISFPPDPPGSVFIAKSLSTDGHYLFLHCSRGLYKIGSGAFGTEKGRIYASNPNFHPTEKLWLGWASGKLFCRSYGEPQLKILNEETLEVKDTVKIQEEGNHFTLFSDGLHVGAIVPLKEDGFVARTVWMETANVAWDTFLDLNLRLVKKSLEVAGPCPWDNESVPRSIVTGIDENVVTICAGKDFALLRTQYGRILYCGKGASLGQKSGITKCSKWLELGLTRCPRFIQCAVGHEGIHALLLAEDGTAYFVGTPKRGEDGDQAKSRRVAKASKPKKVIRMEGHDVTFVSCNNGTSAFVTRTGDVYMFGKDTAHCDPTTGGLVGLRGVFVSQIVMGKAHSVILSSDGKVYTMGINNRGQCGRSWSPHGGGSGGGNGGGGLGNIPTPTNKEGITGPDVLDDDDGEWEDAAGSVVGGVPPPELQEGICPPGSHRWKHEQCMICTICRECTGYGSACISALRPDRNPGQECGCGVGDAGCAECGSCRTCAREGIDDQDYVIIEAQKALDPLAGDLLQFDEERMVRLGVVEGQLEMSLKRPKSSSKLGKRGKENSMTSFPPSPLNLPTPYPIVQVACGLHHSVFLDANGSVFACGSNSFGQLGMGDLSPRHTPYKLRFPENEIKIKQIAAGSYHTVALDSNGVVYTCGSHTKGQLAREPNENKTDPFWFAKMVALPNVGAKWGRRATWISASGDSTFLRFEVSLISPKTLQKSTVTANSSAVMIIPPMTIGKAGSIIMINRKDGCCTYFEGDLGISTSVATLDPIYDFLWAFEGRQRLMKCYNVIASNIRNRGVASNMWLTRPPYAIPVSLNSKIQRWQGGASLLACLDSLIAANMQGLTVTHEEQPATAILSKMYSRDDYASVCRFESHGGGWGYSGHSIEAIRFSCDADVILGGFGLFGGRGEYCAKIKVFDLGPEGGDSEGDGELLMETEEIPYECGPRQKYRMMFEDPVPLQGGRWYVAWAHISGPSSDCGSSGQSIVVTEDQVTFHFKSSKKSNNGTDVNAGQIPQILYRLMTSDPSFGTKQKPSAEPTHLLSNDFISVFSPSCVQILMELITWCWQEVQDLCASSKGKPDIFKAELMEFVSSCALRLIEFGINQAYPLKGRSRLSANENLAMAEVVSEARSRMQSIISCNILIECNEESSKLDHIVDAILTQTCTTFVNCFQVFYPTSVLKWECLSNFMYLYFEEREKYGRMLSAILQALTHCRGQLLCVFPILNTISRSIENSSRPFGGMIMGEGGDDLVSSPQQQMNIKSSCPSKNQVLINQMAARNDVEGFTRSEWTFWDVLDNILVVINSEDGIKEGDGLEDGDKAKKSLIRNSSVLLARLMEELVSHASGTFAELESVIGQVVLITPSRFTRTNQSRTWNTGNGSPDAVCFSTDQTGVTVFGACIYSGTGNYEYELDILQEVDDPQGPGGPSSSLDPDQQNPKWITVEVARGNFESDESYGDVVEIKLPRPVQIKAGVKYGIRLKNHGARTSNGDGGISVLRCPDGTVFTFTSSPLSFNGTNQIRGQIPHLLYFRNPEDSESRLKAKAVSEMQARKCAQRMSDAIFESGRNMFRRRGLEDPKGLSKSCLVTTLLPSILSHLPRLAVSNLRSCVDLLEQVKQLLPSVSELNNKLFNENDDNDNLLDAVHYAWVESEHPYKPATVSHYKVTFPSTVEIMSIEFDPRCCTAQPEDSLRLHIPRSTTTLADNGVRVGVGVGVTLVDEHQQSAAESGGGGGVGGATTTYSHFIPILERYSGRGDTWPKKALIIPGNEVLFSLETASDYSRSEKDSYFGFRCLVAGFEVRGGNSKDQDQQGQIEQEGLQKLEMELAFLGGLCSYELVKKDIVLPPVSAEEVEESCIGGGHNQEKMLEICRKHQHLFAKGIGLEYFPDVNEALDGIVPLREKSKERQFIANFVARTPGTSGERLATWLQPESFVDPQKCEVILPTEPIKRGILTHFTVMTRDQYGELVMTNGLQVEMKAIPNEGGGGGTSNQHHPLYDEEEQPCRHIVEEEMGMRFPNSSSVNSSSRFSFSCPKEYYAPSRSTGLENLVGTPVVPYQVTVKDKMRYHSITMMKEYENVSFEELRVLSPFTFRSSESMMVRQNSGGQYVGTWTPSCTGMYRIRTTIDGYVISESCSVKVEESSEKALCPRRSQDEALDSSNRKILKKRKFKANNSAGLRIRSHPSLQSEQIGVVPVNGVIEFTQEVHNDDGIWVKLDESSLFAYCEGSVYQTCNFRVDGWCLQYNQHVGRTLLYPIEGPKRLPSDKNNQVRKPNNDPSVPPYMENAKMLRLNGSPGIYQVVKCGVSGHNVRSRPCLRSPPVGILVMGSRFTVVDEYMNNEGLWVKLDPGSQRKFCFTSEGEAWSLAVGPGDITYLRQLDSSAPDKGYDFSIASHYPDIFQNVSPPAAFIGQGDQITAMQIDLKDPSAVPHLPSEANNTNTNNTTTGSELPIKEGETIIINNKSLNEEKPKDEAMIIVSSSTALTASTSSVASSPSSAPPSMASSQKSSQLRMMMNPSRRGSDETPSKPVKQKSSSTPLGALQKWLSIGGGGGGGSDSKQNNSNTSSTTSPIKQATSGMVEASKSLVKGAFTSGSSLDKDKGNSKTPAAVLTCTGTQTSPELQNPPAPLPMVPVPHFNIGSTPTPPLPPGGGVNTGSTLNGDKSSIKSLSSASTRSEWKKRGGPRSAHSHHHHHHHKGQRERLKSPPQGFIEFGNPSEIPKKTAIGPGQAQSLRAVFGAILTHNEIVHDAMACASYLRFLINKGAENNKEVEDPSKIPAETSVKEKDSGGVQLSVTMRNKGGLSSSPARSNKSWRHSLEVTTPSQYIRDVGKPVIETEEEIKLPPPPPLESSSSKEQLPLAMSALLEIWKYVKASCMEMVFNGSTPSIEPKVQIQLHPDHHHTKGSSSGGNKCPSSRCKQKGYIHQSGKGTFFLDSEVEQAQNGPTTSNDDEDNNGGGLKCELCLNDCSSSSSSKNKGGSKSKMRKAHFGLTLLCENCSERQLKVKKRQSKGGGGGNNGKYPMSESTLKYYCLHDSMQYCYASLLHNSLFLLQMTNGVQQNSSMGTGESEGQGRSSNSNNSNPQNDKSSQSPIIQQKGGFSCLKSLGISKIDDEDDPFPADIKSPVLLRDFAEVIKLREKRALYGAASITLADEEWDAGPGPSGRRRKGSNGDNQPMMSSTDENPMLGLTLLNYPSAPLQKLMNPQDPSGGGMMMTDECAIQKLCSHVLAFVTERHDLGALKLFLFQAVRKTTCRSYGMQMLAWLLRNVSQPMALHDILWWYASSLEVKGQEGLNQGTIGLDNGWWQLRLHPLSESPSSIFPVFSESFYFLMQTISDLMPHLPVGSPLLEMAVKCWGVSFFRKDHKFLHRSRIFRNLSKIMSQFDGDSSISVEWGKTTTSGSGELGGHQPPLSALSTSLHDITHGMEIKVSSRAALCSSLTDESTETFWESGDEDRNRTKSVTIISACEAIISVIAIYVDNGRDAQYKVSSITVKAGTHADECVKIGQVELDSKHFGWNWFSVTYENAKVIKIEVKGPDNTLRVRQVKVLGVVVGEGGGVMEQSKGPGGGGGLDKPVEPTQLVARRKCENETLRIFRLLSSEVFGKFLYGMRRGESDADGNDLQEHVVGILFSRNKLTHLQKQVCSHIVAAIHREAIKIKEELETQLTGSVLEAVNENIRMITPEKSKISDRYCFEMLTLVLALADHKLGRSYLSQQSNLVQDIMQLLHAGTPRIQRQVIAIIRKVLPEIHPDSFLSIVNQHEPTSDLDKLGILDMFLGCIVKALQVKVRGSQDGNRSAKDINICDMLITEELPLHCWFFRGEGDVHLANSVVCMIKDMCEDNFSPLWAPIAKQAIADAVLYLTKIEEKHRKATECLNSPKFWISLAALSTLHPDHSKHLSSPVFLNGNSRRAKCSNHDDGETLAVLQCDDCGDLCTECDRVLHLPKKNWSHFRKVCKEEEESIKVDLHEGCGRIKLFWLTALVDSSTLKALVEFRNGVPKTVSEAGSLVPATGRCRFCGKVGNSGALALGNVCGEQECQEYSKIACERMLGCGHICGGVRNETKCLPCLQGCSDKSGTMLKQDGDDMCMICFTDALAFAPAIQLSCGHVFHYHCCRTILERRWAGPRITFSFSLCPICKVPVTHNLLDDILQPIKELYEDVRRKALMRLEYEGLNQSEEITSPGSRYYQDPAGFAMDRYAYYVCFKCKKPYFGGEARCDVDLQLDYDPSELLCGACSDISQAQLCPKHGTDYLEYKCRYCCTVAVFFCFGTTHFCQPCHDDFQRITTIPKHQLPQCPAGARARQLEGDECPLHVSHPPTGEEFALGCGICRNAHTF